MRQRARERESIAWGAVRPLLLSGLLLAIVTLWGGAAVSRKPARPPCPDARYLLPAPLVVGNGIALSAVAAGSASVAVADACEPVPPKAYKATRKGTRVKVVWPGCAGFGGKVVLRGVVTDACETLEGRLKARRFRQRFTASRSACGDGVVDRDVGEECDPPAAGTCSPGCRTTVVAPIGGGGGRLTSLDGRLTVDVPPGALASETAITIRRLAPAELPPAALELGLDTAYRLGPPGLAFALPVTIAFRRDVRPPSGGADAAVADLGLLFTLSGGVIELLREQRLHVDAAAGAIVTSAAAAHFSDVFDFASESNPGLATARVELRTTRIPVETNFVVKLAYVSNLRLSTPARVSNEDRTATDVLRYLGELERPAGNGDPLDATLCVPEMIDTDRRNSIGRVSEKGSMVEGLFCYRCLREGSQQLAGQITVQDPDGVGGLFGVDLGDVLQRIANLGERVVIDEVTVDYAVDVACGDPGSPTTTVPGTPGASTSTTPRSSTTSTSATTTTIAPGASCGASLFPQCGGACPPGQTCAALGDPFGGRFCGCVAREQACAVDTCGSCPLPNQFCLATGPPSNCFDAECVEFVTVTTTTSPSSTSSTSTTSTTTTTLGCSLDASQSPRMCGGFCPAGFDCLSVGGACQCVAATSFCRDSATSDICTGFCPSPDQTCNEPPDGPPDCLCFVRAPGTTTTTRPPAACALDAATRVCGGTCPVGLCLGLPDGTCGCVSPGAACGNGGPLCPSPDESCDPTGQCRPRQPCGLVLADEDLPVCFGDCPLGQVCASDQDSCTCVPIARVCQPQPGSTCGGLCPSPVKSCTSVTLPGGVRGCRCEEVDD
jgi:hypothetical protein